jgi:hypothetical protein
LTSIGSDADTEMIKTCAGTVYFGEITAHRFSAVLAHSRNYSWHRSCTLNPSHPLTVLTVLQLSVCLQAFVLAMVAYPDVQKKAQAELDNVVGKDRLPNFGDESSLPYCNAIVKEVLR